MPASPRRTQHNGAECKLFLGNVGLKPEDKPASVYAFVTDPIMRAGREKDAAKVPELAAGGVSLDEPDARSGRR
jgi:hypothetical protein